MTEAWVIRRDRHGGPDWLHAWDDEHVATFSDRSSAMRCTSLDEARGMLSQLRDRIDEYNEDGWGAMLSSGLAFAGHTFTIEPEG